MSTINWLDMDKVKGIKQAAKEEKKRHKEGDKGSVEMRHSQLRGFCDITLYLCEIVEKLNTELKKFDRRKDAE